MARKRFEDPDIGFDLPITPMLDMTFQLLFFFIISYNPSALEGQIEMTLPMPHEKAAEQNPPDTPVPNQDQELSLPADLTIYLGARTDPGNYGRLSFITVKSRNGEETFSDLSALKPYLDNVRETLTNKEDIKIEADARLMWREMIRVIDVCKQGQFKVGFGEAKTGG